MNIIQIEEKFRLQLRNLFVIKARVVSGEVEQGMYLLVNGKPSTFKIYSVESIIGSGKSSLGITFYFNSDQELELIEKLISGFDTLEFQK